jgi:thiol-disulfide isomerase/thioredoxin
MRIRSMIVAAVLASLPAPAVAQTPSAPKAPTVDAKAPGDCVKGLNDWRVAQMTPAAAAVRSAGPEARDSAVSIYQRVYATVNAEAVRSAKECAAKFSVEKTPASQLSDLVSLYTFIGDTTNRRRASDRALAASDLSPRQHGQALLDALGQEIGAAGSHFGILDGPEQVAARIDALPDSLADIKLSAHQTLLGRYEYLDVNEGLRVHATALIALGRRLGKPGAMVMGFESLARSAADRLQPDSALAILADAEKELGTEQTSARFADFRNRYALIGTKAPPVTGAWWLNSGTSTSPVQPGDGKVHLIEFTAHWCVPCKNSYPGLRALAERFKGQPFEGVMVTQLYGYLGLQRPLTPEQEVEADRVFYTQEHGLPFRVAISPRPTGPQQPTMDAAYRIGGFPQIIIVDRVGTIRQIVTGWDQGNTKRIGDLIDNLLKQPTASER